MCSSAINWIAYKKKGPLSFEEAFSNQKADKICAMQYYILLLNLK
jgi:hypothetical protein